jgi:FkbM family methyltransferase
MDGRDILVDVGANMGGYSMLAAARGARVYAFEPESQNYALLNRNIYLNGAAERISAYCVALSDCEKFSQLYLAEFVTASSCHAFGAPLDFRNQPLHAAFIQGAFSTTLDQLVHIQAMPVPTRIKIDVDGIEPKVVAGARRTLQDPRVRSVLIEINSTLDEHRGVVDLMLELGFDYSRDEMRAARRDEGAFKGVGNYVFRR